MSHSAQKAMASHYIKSKSSHNGLQGPAYSGSVPYSQLLALTLPIIHFSTSKLASVSQTYQALKTYAFVVPLPATFFSPLSEGSIPSLHIWDTTPHYPWIMQRSPPQSLVLPMTFTFIFLHELILPNLVYLCFVYCLFPQTMPSMKAET